MNQPNDTIDNVVLIPVGSHAMEEPDLLTCMQFRSHELSICSKNHKTGGARHFETDGAVNIFQYAFILKPVR